MGCFWFGEYAGCVFYTDIILLFVSLKHLQMMLDICTSYADDKAH